MNAATDAKPRPKRNVKQIAIKIVIIILIVVASCLLGISYHDPSEPVTTYSCQMCATIQQDVHTSYKGYVWTGYGWPLNYYSTGTNWSYTGDGITSAHVGFEIISPSKLFTLITGIDTSLTTDSRLYDSITYGTTNTSEPESVNPSLMIANLFLWSMAYLAIVRYLLPIWRGRRVRKQIDAARAKDASKKRM